MTGVGLDNLARRRFPRVQVTIYLGRGRGFQGYSVPDSTNSEYLHCWPGVYFVDCCTHRHAVSHSLFLTLPDSLV